ncbi:hypothetical protein JW905_14990 [bacterium]|nr:hypothetical protein [candidate division CSSED10-310 bacterium]
MTDKDHRDDFIPAESALSGTAASMLVGHLSKRFLIGHSRPTTFALVDSPYIPGLKLLVPGDELSPSIEGILVGTIRMGYGHYRMALSIVSQALSQGITPYWLDLAAFPSPESDAINFIEKYYSFGSRLSDANPVLDKVWERVTDSGGWAAFHLNERLAELLSRIMGDLDRDQPLISSHIFNALIAARAGFGRVFQMIPDNTPIPIHYARGLVNFVQSRSLYAGYLGLGLPPEHLRQVGCYVDHELTANLAEDTAARLERMRRRCRRLLFTIGGAGAQRQLVMACATHLKTIVTKGQATLFINCGDHQAVLDYFRDALHARGLAFREHIGWEALLELLQWGSGEQDAMPPGIHLCFNHDHFAAVLATNRLMRISDILVTKPSELSFYPIPKLFLHRIGRHEAMGALHAAEWGESSVECRDNEQTFRTLDLLVQETGFFRSLNENILGNANHHVYDGAAMAVRMAVGKEQ